MARIIEKTIIVVLCLLSASFIGYMIVSWTSRGTPAAAAPMPPAAAKVGPSAKVDLSSKVDLLAERHRAAKQLRDRATVIRDKRIFLCGQLPLPPRQIEGCEAQAYSMSQLHGMLIDDAKKRGQEAFLRAEAEITATEKYLAR
jgi:hypothetical protein